MDHLLGFAIIITTLMVGLALPGAAALVLGVDSRPSIGDDHAR